jgi:hypothetical protein
MFIAEFGTGLNQNTARGFVVNGQLPQNLRERKLPTEIEVTELQGELPGHPQPGYFPGWHRPV